MGCVLYWEDRLGVCGIPANSHVSKFDQLQLPVTYWC